MFGLIVTTRRRLTEALSRPGVRPRAWRGLPPLSRIAVCFLAVVVLTALLAPWLAPYDPLDQRSLVGGTGAPSADHWMGQDSLGRDILSRLMYGARWSLAIGLGATALALVVGAVVGAVAATSRKAVDETLMRCLDVVMAFPGIALAAVLVAVFGGGITVLICAIAFLFTPPVARVVRANVLDQYGEDYVTAERVIGARTPHIVVRHVAINCAAPVLVFCTVQVAEAIVFEASLSFIGAGVRPPDPSWGSVIADGKNMVLTGGWWATVFPGLLMLATVLCLNILSEGVTDAWAAPVARDAGPGEGTGRPEARERANRPNPPKRTDPPGPRQRAASLKGFGTGGEEPTDGEAAEGSRAAVDGGAAGDGEAASNSKAADGCKAAGGGEVAGGGQTAGGGANSSGSQATPGGRAARGSREASGSKAARGSQAAGGGANSFGGQAAGDGVNSSGTRAASGGANSSGAQATGGSQAAGGSQTARGSQAAGGRQAVGGSRAAQGGEEAVAPPLGRCGEVAELPGLAEAAARLRSRARPLPEGRPVLAVRDLAIGFAGRHRGVDIVDGISFEVRPGEVVGLVGESGCGKSLTALTVMGLQPRGARVRGQVLFGERQLVGEPMRVRRRLLGHEMAMVHQDALSSLNPAMTVRAQLKQVVRRGGSRPAPELLRLVGLDPDRTLRSYPHELSGGQRQRVLIAMALSRDPRLIVADEPTTALDVTVQAQIIELLLRLRADLGFALILVSHDLALVADVTDRVVVMYGGQIVETGVTADLVERPSHPYTRGLLGSVLSLESAAERMTQIRGVVPAPADFPAGCRFADRCPRASEVCRATAPALLGGRTHTAACHHPVVDLTDGRETVR